MAPATTSHCPAGASPSAATKGGIWTEFDVQMLESHSIALMQLLKCNGRQKRKYFQKYLHFSSTGTWEHSQKGTQWDTSWRVCVLDSRLWVSLLLLVIGAESNLSARPCSLASGFPAKFPLSQILIGKKFILPIIIRVCPRVFLAWHVSSGWHPESFFIRFPNRLNWLLSMQRSNYFEIALNTIALTFHGLTNVAF